MAAINDLSSDRRRIVLTMMQAIDEGKLLQVDYNGQRRLVEVHSVGISTAGNPVARVYQTGGGSQSGAPTPWRLFDLDKIPETFSLTEINSEGPREGYNRDDMAMVSIFRQL